MPLIGNAGKFKLTVSALDPDWQEALETAGFALVSSVVPFGLITEVTKP